LVDSSKRIYRSSSGSLSLGICRGPCDALEFMDHYVTGPCA